MRKSNRNIKKRRKKNKSINNLQKCVKKNLKESNKSMKSKENFQKVKKMSMNN